MIHDVALPPHCFKIELRWVFLNSKTMLSHIRVCKQHNQTKTTTYEFKFTTQNCIVCYNSKGLPQDHNSYVVEVVRFPPLLNNTKPCYSMHNGAKEIV
jgi:hypothetical protein